MTDTNVVLLDAAKHIRALATRAANERAGDSLCCWDTERIGGQDRVIQVRRYEHGTDDAIVALLAEGGLAEHVAAWDPPTATAVAVLLEAAAEASFELPLTVRDASVDLAKLLTEQREHGEGE